MPLKQLSQVLALVTAIRIEVVGWSMYPTLAPGERALFDRLAYATARPKVADVVLTRGVPGTERTIIKRVVAAPGDTVRVDSGGVWVNGVPLARDPETDDPQQAERVEWSLEAEQYFLMGDAWDMSTDSRTFGPVARSAIKARALLVYWPWARRRPVVGGWPRTDR